MATTEQLEARLEALRKARASGVRSVQHGDTVVTYKSDDEMASAIADLEAQITGTPVKLVYPSYSKGT